jgi:hypothetical protein
MANEAQNLKIRFEGLSVAEAGNKAEGLRRDLLEVSPDVRVKIEQEDPSNQDFGATLVLILGAPAAVAVAKGVADYLRRVGGKITIEADGKIIGENIAGDDIGKIEQALSSRR